MANDVHTEISSCIRELYSIANALEDAADEVTASIQGMSTWYYTNALYICADRYRKAAQKLEKID